MPLLLMTGKPSSGKTTVANRVADAFKERGVESILVTDASVNSQYNRSADFYLDKRKNVDHFNSLKSEVMRRLGSNNKEFVIVDSLNYARSQRYELFTVAKNNRTTFGILLCDVDDATTDSLNDQREDKYDPNVIQDLRNRFERPRPPLKGDKPVFELQISREEEDKTPKNIILPIDDLNALLIEGKPLVENRTAVAVQKLSSNSISEIDNTTQKIVKHIVENQHSVGLGGTLALPWNTDVKFMIKQFQTLMGLNRVRGRFMDMARQGLVLATENSVDQRFVDYISATDS